MIGLDQLLRELDRLIAELDALINEARRPFVPQDMGGDTLPVLREVIND